MARIRRDPKPPAPPSRIRVSVPSWLSVVVISGSMAAAASERLPWWGTLCAMALSVAAAFSLGNAFGSARPDPSARARVVQLENTHDYYQRLAIGALVGLRGGATATANGRSGPSPAGVSEPRPAAPVTAAQQAQALDRALRGEDAAISERDE